MTTSSLSRLGDTAYHLVRRDILNCRLMPGSKLTEPELMKTYGISKTSCRSALIRLCHEHLVTSIPRKGYRVAPVKIKDVEEVFSLRTQLEPFAARLAVGKVDIERLKTLEAACRTHHPVPLHEQIDIFMDANKAFHMEIVRASGNERLQRTLSTLMDEISRLVALGFNIQGTKPGIKHDHNAMIVAFEEQDEKRAEFIARRHIETFQSMTLEKVYSSLSDSGTALPVLPARQPNE